MGRFKTYRECKTGGPGLKKVTLGGFGTLQELPLPSKLYQWPQKLQKGKNFFSAFVKRRV